MLDLTEQQLENASADSTRPIFLIEHTFSGVVERASCNGNVQFNSNIYSAGGANLKSVKDSKSASFQLFATPERIAGVDFGTWRNGAVKVYYIPGMPDDTELVYDAVEGILIIDGEMVSAKFDGKNYIEVVAKHLNDLSTITPRHMWDAVSIHCPPSGSELTWEGDRYILQPRVTASSVDRSSPETLGSISHSGIAGISARKARQLSQPQQTVTLTSTGENSPIKLIFGEPSIPGDIIAIGNLPNSGNPDDLVIAIGWGYGEVKEITKLFINDTEIVDGGIVGTDITFTNYWGRFNQGVDPTLELAIAAFNSDFVLRTPDGVVGTAYTVFRIPTGVLDSSPKFNAIIKGLGVYDPRTTGENSQSYNYNSVELSFSTGEAVDYSPMQLPYTLEGEISVGKTELVCSGAGYLSIPYDASMVVEAGDPFTFLMRFTIDKIDTQQWLFSSECDALRFGKGWALVLSASNELQLFTSADGLSWDANMPKILATGVEVGDAFVTAFVRNGPYSGFVVNGVNTASYIQSDDFYNNGALGLVIGARADSTDADSYFTGRVNYFRYAVGVYDTSSAAGEMISGLPFPDYQQYSDTSVLCGGQVVVNPVYGLGKRIFGLGECADFNEDLLQGGFQRCTLALGLSTPQSTSSVLDLLLSEYGESFWFNTGRDVSVTPNSIASGINPSGIQAAGESTLPFNDSNWNVVSGDAGAVSFVNGQMIIDGTQTGLVYVQALITDGEPNTRYALESFVESLSGGYYIVLITNAIFEAGVAYGSMYTTDTGLQGVTFAFSPGTTAVVDYVKLTRQYWREDSLVKGSLKIEGIAEDQAPTQVKTRYTEPNPASPNWPTVPGTPLSRVGVTDGSIPLIDTSIYLEGVISGIEANNKSNNKLARYNNQIKYTYETTDTGIRHKRGDIVQLTRANYGVDLIGRILNTEMASYGRYKVTAMRYNDDQYPSEVLLPEGDGVVPLGTIVLMNGATVPDGWDRFADADGRYIMGAGGSYNPGDTGGSATFAGFAGNTSEENAHGVDNESDYSSSPYAIDILVPGDGGTVDRYGYHQEVADDTTHSHSYDSGVLDPGLMTRSQRLMIKVDQSATTFPKEAQVFALDNIIAEGVQRLTANAGRLIAASNSEANTGSTEFTVDLTLSDESINHRHYEQDVNPEPNKSSSTAAAPTRYYTYETQFGTHNHGVTRKLVERNTKKMPVALFGSDAAFKMVPGMYIFWAGSLDSLPTDFVLADGSNSTFDFRDCFVEIAVNGQEGSGSGNNIMTFLSRYRWTQNHDHEHGEFYYPEEPLLRFEFPHDSRASHRHELTANELWRPQFYTLAVLMYAPTA